MVFFVNNNRKTTCPPGVGAATHRTVSAPASKVWAAVTDPISSCASASGSAEMIDGSEFGQPLHVGSRWRETREISAGGIGGGIGKRCRRTYTVVQTCTHMDDGWVQVDGDGDDDVPIVRRRSLSVVVEIPELLPGTVSTGSVQLYSSSSSLGRRSTCSSSSSGSTASDDDIEYIDDTDEAESCRLVVSIAMIPQGLSSTIVSALFGKFLGRLALRHVQVGIEDICSQCENKGRTTTTTSTSTSTTSGTTKSRDVHFNGARRRADDTQDCLIVLEGGCCGGTAGPTKAQEPTSRRVNK